MLIARAHVPRSLSAPTRIFRSKYYQDLPDLSQASGTSVNWGLIIAVIVLGGSSVVIIITQARLTFEFFALDG